jgi:hypothetical protein
MLSWLNLDSAFLVVRRLLRNKFPYRASKRLVHLGVRVRVRAK